MFKKDINYLFQNKFTKINKLTKDGTIQKKIILCRAWSQDKESVSHSKYPI